MRMRGLTILLLGLMVRSAWAEVPPTMSYQGVLKENSIPVPDSSYSLTFRLYADTTQPALWTETQSLATSGGVFSAILGSVTPLNLPFDQQYYLGTAVGGDPEMTPRVKLSSAPYSIRSSSSSQWSFHPLTNAIVTTDSTSRVGIGTVPEAGKSLHVKGSVAMNGRLYLYPEGNWPLTVTEILVSGVGSGPGSEGSPWTISRRGDIGGSNEDLKFVRHLNGQNMGVALQLQNSTGNVGIGTSNPQAKLDVNGEASFSSGASPTLLKLGYTTASNTNDSHIDFFRGTTLSTRLGVNADRHFALEMENELGSGCSFNIHEGRVAINARMPQYYYYVPQHSLEVFGDSYVTGNVGIGTNNPQVKLDVAGVTKTHILQITGGSDLAEPFPMSNPEIDIEPGTVVVIDPEYPGKLRVSSTAYDSKVAGIVSGAGGIIPGLTLNQSEVLGEGKNVALSGRVYVHADASNGSIRAGDLLTTSEVDGYAMKVTNYSRAQGAVIGKAMSELDSGQGLVLVLINLQ